MPTPSPSNKPSDKNKAVLLGIATLALLGIVGYETFREKEFYQETPIPSKISIPSIPLADMETEGLRIKMAHMNEKLNEMKRLLFVRGQAPDASQIRDLTAQLHDKNKAIDELNVIIAAKENQANLEKSKVTTLEHSLSALADLIEIQRASKENYHIALQDSMNRAKSQLTEEHSISLHQMEQNLQTHLDEIRGLNEKIVLQKEQIHTLTDSLESELHLKKQDIAEFNQALQAASHQYAGLIDETLIEKTLHSMQALEQIDAKEQELLAYKDLTAQLEKQVALLTDGLQEFQFETLKEKLDLADALQDKDFLLQQSLNELNEIKQAHLAERNTLLDSRKETEEHLIAEHKVDLETHNQRLHTTLQAHDSVVQDLQTDCESLKKELEDAKQQQETLKQNLVDALHDLEAALSLNEHMESLLRETSHELDEIKQAHISETEKNVTLEYVSQEETKSLQCQVEELGVAKQAGETAIESLQKECEELKKDLAESKEHQDTLREELLSTLSHLENSSNVSQSKDALLSKAALKLNETEEKHSAYILSLEAAKQAEVAMVEALKLDLAAALQGHGIDKEHLDQLKEHLEASKIAENAMIEALQKELTDTKSEHEGLKHELALAHENLESFSNLQSEDHNKHLALLKVKEELEHFIAKLETDLQAQEEMMENLKQGISEAHQHHGIEKEDLDAKMEALHIELAESKERHGSEKENLEKQLAALETEKQDQEALLESMKLGITNAHEYHGKEKEDLAAKIDALHIELAVSKERHGSEKEDLEKRLAALEAEKQDQEDLLESLKLGITDSHEYHGKEKEDLAAKIDALHIELAASKERHGSEKEDLEKRLAAIESEKKEQESQLESLKLGLTNAHEYHGKEKENLEQMIAQLDAAKQAEVAMVETLQHELEENKALQDSLKQDLTSALQNHGSEKEDLENLIHRLDAAKQAEVAMVEVLQQELAEAKSEQDALKEKLKSVLDNLESASNLHLDEHHKNLSLTQEKENLEHLMEHLEAAKDAEVALTEILKKELAESKEELTHLAEHKDALLMQAAHELNETQLAHINEQEHSYALNVERKELREEIQKLQETLKQAEQALQDSSHTLASLQGEMKDKAVELDSSKQERETLLENLKTLNSSLEQEREQAKQIASKLSKMQSDYEKVIAIQDIDNPSEEEPYFDDPTGEEDDD